MDDVTEGLRHTQDYNKIRYEKMIMWLKKAKAAGCND
jgi:hypothetical protein